MDPNQETTLEKVVLEPEKNLKSIDLFPNLVPVTKPKLDFSTLEKQSVINCISCALTAVFSIITVYYEVIFK